MKNTLTRRSVIGAAAAGLTPKLASAASSQRARMKVGLYSITYLGVWYRGDALSHEQLIERAKRYGYDGIELDGKRPHGNPLDMPKKRCEEIRKRAQGEGVPLYAVSGNNDFSSPIPEHREAQLVYMRDLIRMTSDLGAKTLRVFFGWTGVTAEPLPKGGGRYDIARLVWKTAHDKFSDEQTWEWCRQGLAESARWAKDHGVTLALQNHAPVVNDYPDVLRMVKEVDSPNLKVCLDVPLLKDKEEAAILKAAKAVGRLQILSHFGGEYEEAPDGTVKGKLSTSPSRARWRRSTTPAISVSSCAIRCRWWTGRPSVSNTRRRMPGWPRSSCAASSPKSTRN